MKKLCDYAVQHYDVDQMEDEQNIYEDPCENDGDYGPVYTEPLKAMERIYEMFKDKRICKLYHQNIRYPLLCILFKQVIY